MKKGKRKEKVTSESVTTGLAAELMSSIGSSRSGRDSLTRVMSPIKGIDTHSRQWSRNEGWTP